MLQNKILKCNNIQIAQVQSEKQLFPFILPNFATWRSIDGYRLKRNGQGAISFLFENVWRLWLFLFSQGHIISGWYWLSQEEHPLWRTGDQGMVQVCRISRLLSLTKPDETCYSPLLCYLYNSPVKRFQARLPWWSAEQGEDSGDVHHDSSCGQCKGGPENSQ